jgi:hypothetical protein
VVENTHAVSLYVRCVDCRRRATCPLASAHELNGCTGFDPVDVREYVVVIPGRSP